MCDPPHCFGNSMVDRPKSSLEVIRRPAGLVKNATTFNLTASYGGLSSMNSSMKGLNRTATEYMNQKITSHAKKLSAIKIPSVDEVPNLMIEGINKLNCEIDAVFKGAGEKKEVFMGV